MINIKENNIEVSGTPNVLMSEFEYIIRSLKESKAFATYHINTIFDFIKYMQSNIQTFEKLVGTEHELSSFFDPKNNNKNLDVLLAKIDSMYLSKDSKLGSLLDAANQLKAIKKQLDKIEAQTSNNNNSDIGITGARKFKSLEDNKPGE